MKVLNSILLPLIATGALAAASSASAAVILAVDFNQTANANSITETGFSTFALPAGNGTIANPSQAFGDITVNLLGLSVSSRVRNAIADNAPFTYNDLYRDFANQLIVTSVAAGLQTTTNPTAHAFTIGGLAASTTYNIRVWTLDTGFNNGAVTAWYNTTAGTGASSVLLGAITNSTAPTFADNNAYSVSASVTSDATGLLRFGAVTQNGVSGVINGFELTGTVVPEPSTYALMGGVVVLAIAALRRRR
ncbi:MAG: PEP-CTERM sorting domain-containing protein [Verrucomicrobiota bacterium]|nr:PEP-CTERM sorting domain-containing protein [Verrucomicrobiota bacterium]